MTTGFPISVQAVLLLERQAQLPDLKMLLIELNEVLSEELGPVRILDDAEDHLRFATNTLVGTIARTAVPYPDGPLQKALNAPMHKLTGNSDLKAAVQAHQAHIAITLDAAPNPPEDHAGFDLRLRALTRIAHSAFILTIEDAPLALFWSQSAQIFAPREAIASLKEPVPFRLLVQPGYFTDGRQTEDGLLVGIRAIGTETYLGREVVFAPHPQAPQDSYLEVLAFVMAGREAGGVLPDGAAFAGQDGTPLKVRWESVAGKAIVELHRPAKAAPAPVETQKPNPKRSPWNAAQRPAAPPTPTPEPTLDARAHLPKPLWQRIPEPVKQVAAAFVLYLIVSYAFKAALPTMEMHTHALGKPPMIHMEALE